MKTRVTGKNFQTDKTTTALFTVVSGELQWRAGEQKNSLVWFNKSSPVYMVLCE